MTDDLTAQEVWQGFRLVESRPEVAAAERAVVDTGVARYLAAERGVPRAEFVAVCEAFNDACRDLLRLRAAQESGRKDGCVDLGDIRGGRCRLTADGVCKKGLDCPLMRARFG